jgi:hypothetical protein
MPHPAKMQDGLARLSIVAGGWAALPSGHRDGQSPVDQREEESTMTRMFIRHDVSDYKVWRSVYDGFNGERKTMGVMGDAVYRAADNPSNITIWHDFADLKTAQSFASSQRLKDVMGNAGVVSAPEVWFTSPA